MLIFLRRATPVGRERASLLAQTRIPRQRVPGVPLSTNRATST
jgi:hypothetical protein